MQVYCHPYTTDKSQVKSSYSWEEFGEAWWRYIPIPTADKSLLKSDEGIFPLPSSLEPSFSAKF
jgi:hypothetical protein